MKINYPLQRKYKNVLQTYNGYSYHSKKEAQYAFELDCRVKAKDIKGWDRQVKIELDAYDVPICNYYMDFVVYHNDGKIEYVEVKGFETDVWRLKWKLFKAKMAKKQPSAILTLIK